MLLNCKPSVGPHWNLCSGQKCIGIGLIGSPWERELLQGVVIVVIYRLLFDDNGTGQRGHGPRTGE